MAVSAATIISRETFYIRLLIKRLSVVLMVFTVCRCLFYFLNRHYFSDSRTVDILLAFVTGLRFDISAIIYINILFIALHIIPHPYRRGIAYQRLTKYVFYLFNGIGLFFSVIDLEYFKYSKKRTTSDLFGMSSDWDSTILQYLRDFWYLVLILTFLILIMEVLYRKISQPEKSAPIRYFPQIVLFLLTASLFAVGARGGLQLKPLKITDAAFGVGPRNIALVLNTPFTILRTFGRPGLREVNYLEEPDAEKLVLFRLPGGGGKVFLKKNVLIIIVESLSREFMKWWNPGGGFTPFLDSLSGESLLCANAFANGTRSMEAVPAIFAGIPNLMNDSYIYSVYQGNEIGSIASLLRSRGYWTSFFHGGTNGTMGFDSFIRIAGFENYYGRTEYGKDADYDGFWGIYDEEFLQYAARILNAAPSPFCAALFTLSSHHPYSIPEKYKKKFQSGQLPIQRSIMYADYSLRRFFETISAMPWYGNTLFVITGDHTPAETEDPFYRTEVGIFALPLIFFEPKDKLRGLYDPVVQHIDIMPSVLDYLNFDGDYSFFGRSIFDSAQERYVYNYLNNYLIFDGKYTLSFDGNSAVGLYNYASDTLLRMNLVGSHGKEREKLEARIKAAVQLFNKALIHNEMRLR